jgi:hypothetical protein
MKSQPLEMQFKEKVIFQVRKQIISSKSSQGTGLGVYAKEYHRSTW